MSLKNFIKEPLKEEKEYSTLTLNESFKNVYLNFFKFKNCKNKKKEVVVYLLIRNNFLIFKCDFMQ